MNYKMKLTTDEIATLSWLRERGYDCGLYDALEADEQDSMTADGYVHFILEHKAWEIVEASEDVDSGFACLDWGSSLGVKIRAFLDEVV